MSFDAYCPHTRTQKRLAARTPTRLVNISNVCGLRLGDEAVFRAAAVAAAAAVMGLDRRRINLCFPLERPFYGVD